ncbi:DMT family transporter [Clostridium lundense]|uniref:DMT family transporter n=1 Tax=Clostridium lundense TaxID=319475 RepID=UPI00047FBBF5|nr:DMT family transporter [Clostridium lundense]
MNRLYGIFYVILSSVCFSVMPIFAKFCYKSGMNSYNVLFFRFLIAVIILLFYLKIKGISLKIEKSQFAVLFFLSTIGYSATSLLLFLSYNYISVGMATIIHFIYPLMVTIASFLIYKEKITIKKLCSLFLAIIGVYILIGFENGSLNKYGVIISFLSAIFYAYYIIGASNEKVKTMNNFVMTFYITLISSFCIGIMCLFRGDFYFKTDILGVVSLILIGLISTVISLMTLIEGIKIVGPSVASILNTLEPILSIILGIVILKEPITINIVIGTILVLLSVIIITLDKNSMETVNVKDKDLNYDKKEDTLPT